MKKHYIIYTVAAIAGLTLAFGPKILAAPNEQVDVCHKTHSESNPWVVQRVHANQLQSHLDNGDFVYAGPLKENGHPDQKAGDEWCANNADPEEPVVNPETPLQTMPGTSTHPKQLVPTGSGHEAY